MDFVSFGFFLDTAVLLLSSALNSLHVTKKKKTFIKIGFAEIPIGYFWNWLFFLIVGYNLDDIIDICVEV